MERKDLTEDLEEAFENSRYATDVDRVESRRCSSDMYPGIEYGIYGRFVPVIPIMNLISEVEGHGIEELQHINEDEPYLSVFVATFGQKQQHPAFAP